MPVYWISSDGQVGERQTRGFQGQVQEATRTSFDNTAAPADVQVRDNQGDVRNVQNLCPVGKSHGPELWSGSKDMDEALSGARSQLRPVRHADEVYVSVVPKLAVKVLPRSND